MRAQAGGGGVGGARAVADTRTRESRLTSDPWVVEVYVARMDFFVSRASALNSRAAGIPVLETWRRLCVCARARAHGGMRPWNVAGGGAGGSLRSG